mgnify:CR=1 FL=1
MLAQLENSSCRNIARFICLGLRGDNAFTTREDEEHARHAEISTGTIMSVA